MNKIAYVQPSVNELSMEQLTELKSIMEAGNCSYTLECDDKDYIVRDIFLDNNRK